MTEHDIRGNCLVLMTLARNEIAKAGAANEPNAEMLVNGVGALLTQVLVDLNRIAAALEHIALHKQV